MVTKKQHYYPRCLLKHFANDDKKVFVYIRQGDKIERMNYEKICASTYTYESDDQVDNVLEQKLGKYESKIEPIIDDIINNCMTNNFSVSKEDQQEIAEKGKQFLDDMFTQMGLTVVIEKMMTKDKITFQVHGEDLGILIGKHGQTLDAIQYLTNLVAHKDVSGHCHIVVDVENYRSRREETLVNLAKRLASKVKRNRQKVSLEPMNAFERKIIHTALQGDKNVVTNSEGDEPFRHVVISYKK